MFEILQPPSPAVRYPSVATEAGDTVLQYLPERHRDERADRDHTGQHSAHAVTEQRPEGEQRCNEPDVAGKLTADRATGQEDHCRRRQDPAVIATHSE